jgi:hypothetical protein
VSGNPPEKSMLLRGRVVGRAVPEHTKDGAPPFSGMLYTSPVATVPVGMARSRRTKKTSALKLVACCDSRTGRASEHCRDGSKVGPLQADVLQCSVPE